MPRAGLDPDRVAREGLRLVDEAGVGALSIATLAARLGVQRPSLYNHTRSVEGLRETLRAMIVSEVADTAEAVVPRKGREGLFTMMRALRAYLVRYPRRIDFLIENTESATGPLRDASDRLLRPVMELLGSYGLSGARAVHAARMLRTLWIGFALLESRRGYAIDVPVDQSFTFALEAAHRAFARKPNGAAR